MAGGHDLPGLIASAPLAWLVTRDAATPLPILPVGASDGTLRAVRGHFARRNPQVDALRRDPRATILLMGPQGYVSPSWLSDRTQAPTWNYAAARLSVDIALIEDRAWLVDHLDALVTVMETGRPRAWSLAEMGERLDRLARGIVGFEAQVIDASPAMKLGQAERDGDYTEIVAGLSAENEALVAWMTAYNPDRPVL